jgi:hypothetical protein
VRIAIESVNDITQQAAAAAGQMASSVAQMSGMAQELRGLVSRFRLEDDHQRTGVVQGTTTPAIAES